MTAVLDLPAAGARETEGAARIPGAKISKTEWWFRPADRMVLQVSFEMEPGPEGKPHKVPVGEPVGTVPPVTGWVTKKDEDGQDTTIEYRLKAKNGRCVVVSEDDLDRGTWAGKVGQERPSGNDAKLAFALVIRQEARDRAPEVTAVPYIDGGRMFFPEADTQNIGYRQLAGEEEKAREVWRTILGHAMAHPKTLLALGSFFCGPLVAPFDLVAFIANLVGPGQQGKSTTQVVQAGLFGRIEEGILRSWNSSAQGIPQILRRARYLPLALEENSAKGDGVAKTEQMMSAMVGGANRATGSADGNGGTSLGRWRSSISSSSNLSLRRPGQSEDLASRLYELEAPFWPNVYVNRDGQVVPEGTARSMHLSKWVKRAAANFHGWPFEWAIRGRWFTAEGLERLQDAHDGACQRIAPKGGGIAGTVGEIHALWAVGAHLLGLAVGVENCGPVAEAEAVRQLPAALISSSSAALTPAEQLWEAITAAMAQNHRFPAVDLSAEGVRQLKEAMEARGSDVHGFVSPADNRLWVIPGKLREIADRARLADVLHAGLAGLKAEGVLVPGDSRNLPAKPPRTFRGTPGLGARLYRFDLDTANTAFGQADEGPEGGPDNGGPGGPQGGPATGPGSEGPAVAFCTGYDSQGRPCGLPVDPEANDDGRHFGCVPGPTPAGPSEQAPAHVPAPAPAPAPDPLPWDEDPIPAPRTEAAPASVSAPAVRHQEDVPAPADDVPAPRPARKRGPSLVAPEGPHAEFLAAAVARKSVTNAAQLDALARRLVTLDEAQAALSVMDEDSEEAGDALRKWAGKMRLLAALEGDRDGSGPFAPRRGGRWPLWMPERPGMIEGVQVRDGWTFGRDDYEGEAVVLDRNASWPSAVSSVAVAHGQLIHRGELGEISGQPDPGYYRVMVHPWTEADMPSPLEGAPVGSEWWITGTKLGLLTDLVAEGRWPDAHVYDAYTGEPVRLREWAHLLGEVRRYSLDTYGRKSDAYDVQKTAFGMATVMMLGTPDGTVGRKWFCKSRRTDWTHAIKDQAAVTVWRTADKVRAAGVLPLEIRATDELVIPADALETVTTGKRPAVRLSEDESAFGTWKVKDTEAWGDE